MKNFKNSIVAKMLFIFVIVLVLLIPKSMITSLVHEREEHRTLSIESVTGQWSENQTFIGPIVSIPYYRYITLENTDTIKKQKEYIHILPKVLNAEATIKPEIRQRGIYEVVVYNSVLTLDGSFDIEYGSFDNIAEEDILVEQALVSFGLSDLRGIENNATLTWNKGIIAFESGLKTNTFKENNTKTPEEYYDEYQIDPDLRATAVKGGLHARVGSLLNDTQHEFSFTLKLKGSDKLQIVPVGKETKVTMNSSWNAPSFIGNFLPDSRELSKDGFSASWDVLHLNRNFPQMWTSATTTHASALHNSAFGTQLLVPVDHYQKSIRTAKYAVLIIVLTFLTFLFIELLYGKFSPIHPIQYLLVGLALLLFYSLLLAISEHLGFNAAFIIAAIATLCLITAHMHALLKLWRISALIAGILTILYGFVFVIIQLEDYALLVGAIVLFVILALVMHFARKIDWYSTSAGHEPQNPRSGTKQNK